ncbi:class I SAM-dependent methyltransferase [Frankia sp. CNm7]|uniref:Class I SAM-dependent methyltransferase n=1 Tax=Frankia nepalensis TaxID=1836974 RepID=A0A937RR73_9ACTN|nr:class I SAM-dependent methyltransferase [Frankia nepalensis]MBL7497298.1 class I SAM-dependent methyltransferase [Frankia nepalensis]MBL7514493.1 class I SAM-dependent methyltransferase [Frankia nepalensis]MBL7523409.1 class I SAM-dependent methyltransferase [Frankia nepalensis]MBL7631208.1 class I SAM-dependent methyltransferase [Frankia nepalensis]
MSLEDTARDWTRHGNDDPLWAVLVDPAKRGGGWDIDDFLATGKEDVDTALGVLDRLGGTPTQTGVALDFGCGAGRLTQALAAHYDKVIGLDISEPMLATARRLDRTGGRADFQHNATADLAAIPTASVDLVFTSIVLQHVPPDAAEKYLLEFGRVLRPGGAAIILMPTGIRPTIQGLLFRYAPPAVVGALQQRLLHYPAPMQMNTLPVRIMTSHLSRAGLRIIGTTDEPQHAPHWNFTRYYAIRPKTSVA